jgi:CheY-like chemotaxis protein
LAQNGQSGLDIAREQVPDLIISDVMMPIMDGYELAQQLKSNELTNHIPIILLTAKGSLESRVKGQQMPGLLQHWFWLAFLLF